MHRNVHWCNEIGNTWCGLITITIITYHDYFQSLHECNNDFMMSIVSLKRFGSNFS